MTEEGQRNLTCVERRAIRALERVASSWPETLVLYSNNGALEILDATEYGLDPVTARPLAEIYGIRNDGGDRT